MPCPAQLGDTSQAMSQRNVEVIRRSYEEFARGHLVLDVLDPGIEWRGPREFPDLAQPHYGHDGVRRYFARIREAFDDYRVVAEDFIDAGEDRVLVLAREGGRGKGSGASVQTRLTAHLWTFSNDKAVRMQSYWERSDAFEAVGLER
jgi:ketosteroid isomerase-like protein